MTRFDEWLEVAAKHPFGYGVETDRGVITLVLSVLHQGSGFPQGIADSIHSAILMNRKGVVWFDENGGQVGASAYQGCGARYIWIGADMGKPKEPSA